MSLLLVAICLAAGLRFAAGLRPPATASIEPERFTHADLAPLLLPRHPALARERGFIVATRPDRKYPGLTHVSLGSEDASAVELLIFRP